MIIPICFIVKRQIDGLSFGGCSGYERREEASRYC